MTQVCEPAIAVSITSPASATRPSVGDRVLAAQMAELETAPAGHLAELRTALVLATSVHDEAVRLGVPAPRGLARLRDLGARWALTRSPLDPLLAMLRAITEKVAHAVASDSGDIDLTARVRANGNAFVREVLTGFQQSYEADLDRGDDDRVPLDHQLLASSLLWSDKVPDELRARTAESYAVVAVHWPSQPAHEANTLLRKAFQTCGGRGTLSLVSGDDVHVLVPALNEEQAISLCREVHRLLGGDLRLAVCVRDYPEVGAGRLQAESVLALTREREPGAYHLGDVLVEYAVMHDSAVVGNLISVITPILRQGALRTTLDVFIEANGNRSKAAGVLNIHRSTLDHRLGRIEQLTGYQPTSARGVQVLATALAVYKTLHGEPSDLEEQRSA